MLPAQIDYVLWLACKTWQRSDGTILVFWKTTRVVRYTIIGKVISNSSCDHALCNTHHLRELIYLAEQDQQEWAEKLIKLLLEAKELVEATPENCLVKSSAELASIDLRYNAILAEGFSQDIPPPTKTGKKKRGSSETIEIEKHVGSVA